jgi:hypothetical protein
MIQFVLEALWRAVACDILIAAGLVSVIAQKITCIILYIIYL